MQLSVGVDKRNLSRLRGHNENLFLNLRLRRSRTLLALYNHYTLLTVYAHRSRGQRLDYTKGHCGIPYFRVSDDGYSVRYSF